ncbi:MAG: hypothetical protein M3R08_06415, partial [Bacteroidota bacterium]|nr:hypothetical protein [Bacteroidota bacterium]
MDPTTVPPQHHTVHPDHVPHMLGSANLPPDRRATMEFFMWYWWAGLAIILFIAEIFVPGFFLFCLGVGCIGGSVAAGIGLDPSIQLASFSIFSMLTFVLLRPIMKKRMWKGPEIRMN